MLSTPVKKEGWEGYQNLSKKLLKLVKGMWE